MKNLIRSRVSAPRNTGTYMHRILIGTPTLGQVRIEWHNALSNVVIPCNWSNSMNTPVGFLVADAQNLLVRETLDHGFTWLFLLEDDVLVPPDIFLKFAPYLDAEHPTPIVSGLYHLKGPAPRSEPLIYRGRGNGAFRHFKPGDKVWVDGVPTGCLLIHAAVLRVMANAAPTYTVRANQQQIPLKRVFYTPREVFQDAGTGAYQKLIGTSDLQFCDQIIKEKILAKAGFPEVGRRRYPFLVDTGLRCGHIDRTTGTVF